MVCIVCLCFNVYFVVTFYVITWVNFIEIVKCDVQPMYVLSIYTNIEMWVMGNHNLPYTSHDINVVIESYHANLKATWRVTKS